MKQYHLRHHFISEKEWFGVSNPSLDSFRHVPRSRDRADAARRRASSIPDATSVVRFLLHGRRTGGGPMTETIEEIVARHAGGGRVVDTIEAAYARIEAHADPALFIALRPKADALAEAAALDAAGAGGPPAVRRPLRGQGQHRLRGSADHRRLSRLRLRARASRASSSSGCRPPGAIVVGKTNLDQFATGLVGVRSPYGVPRNALRAELIPGGSSSGSATAVAAGLVPFALGTDTAGSGRVPAALNGIVGLKPTLGSLSASGVVPACRTLDTISVFALTVGDAFAVYRDRGRLRRGGRLFETVSRTAARLAAASSGRRATAGAAGLSRRRGSGARFRGRSRTAGGSRRARSWNSTSRRSSRSRGCSTRDPGSPSATPRPSG